MAPRNRPLAAGLAGLIALWILGVGIEASRRPIWFDEIFTIWIARQAPREILRHLRLDSGPPLFYLIEKPFVLLGEHLRNDSAVRFPSFLAVAGLLALAFRRRVTAGGSFVPLMATSPLLFFYAAEGRAYAMVSLASFVLFLAATRLRNDGLSAAIALAASASLSGLHYIGLLVVGGGILAALVAGRRRIAVASAGGAIAALAPWLPVALAQPPASLSWSQENLGPSIVRSAAEFGFWAPTPGYFSSAALPFPIAGVLLGGSIILLTAAALRRRRKFRPAAVFVFFPLVAAALLSVWRPIYFAGRTEMAVWPAALWVVARASRADPRLRTLAGTAAAAGAAAIMIALLHPPLRAPYLENAALVARIRPTPALVVAADADYLPLRLEADRGHLAPALAGLPHEVESHPGWFLALTTAEAAREAENLGRRISLLPPDSTAMLLLPSDPVLAQAVSTVLQNAKLPALRLRVSGRVLVVTN